MSAMNDYTTLMKKISYSFKDLSLLDVAITHSSFNENSKKFNYERLEFLGDRVLGLIISNEIYQKFKDESEGDLAKRLSYLVCKKTLKKVAGDISLDQYVKLANDLSKSSIESIKANSLEALVAAIFLDSNLEVASKIILKLWKKYLNEDDLPLYDPKSKLQEWCLKNKKRLPTYELIKKIGPDHKPVFTIKVKIDDQSFSTAKGKSKQDAEINAATKLLKKID